MKRQIAIIPAAGLGARFHELGKHYPKCLLPYNGKTLLEATLTQLVEQTPIREVFVGIRPEDVRHPLFAKVRRAMREKHADLLLYYVAVHCDAAHPSGPANTLLRCLEEAQPQPGTPVLMVLSDSLFPGLELGGFLGYDAIATMRVQDQSRWCMVANQATKTVFWDKPTVPVANYEAVSGVYAFTCGHTLYYFANGVVTNTLGEPQFREILERYSAMINGHKFQLVSHEPSALVDFGTLEEFLRVRSTCKPREFNELLITDNTVTKRSYKQPSKIMAEAAWYQLMPTWAQHYLPRLHSVSPTQCSYTMEFLFEHNARYLALYYDKSYATWSKLFGRVSRFISLCHVETQSVDGGEHFWRSMVAKTRERTVGIDTDDLIDRMVTALTVAGVWGERSFFHGDLHFANMFWNYGSERVKFIDPRGEVYGHWLYDVAKLAHSVYGAYDYIDEGLYADLGPEGAYLYRSGDEGIRKAFKEVILSLLTPAQLDAVKVVTASLFASMIPLHADRRHQELFLREYHRISDLTTDEFFA